jgi:hypothetical protein
MVSIIDTNFIYQLVNDSYLRVHEKTRGEIEGARSRRSWGRMSLMGTSNHVLNAVLPVRPWNSKSGSRAEGRGNVVWP